MSLQNCYHCLASQRNKKRTLEHQNSMVVKKYGSMVNPLEGSHNQQTWSDLQLERRDKSGMQAYDSNQ